MTDQTVTTFEYEYHPLAEMFPLIEGDEFDALVEDIASRGLLVPIIRHQGKIIDGRNRYRAAKVAGYKFTERDFRDLAPGLDAEAFVISANIQRRQLTSEQKREFVAKLIEGRPDASDRAIARLACCDNKTVAKVRKDIQDRLSDFIKEWEGLNRSQQREFITTTLKLATA